MAEVARQLVRRAPFEEVGAQGLVHALARAGGLLEEAAAFCYVFRCAYSHASMVLHTRHSCQAAVRPQYLVGSRPHEGCTIVGVCVHIGKQGWPTKLMRRRHAVGAPLD